MGMFSFMDMHQRQMPAVYQQLADAGALNNPSAPATAQVTEQMKNVQALFTDPAQLAKIVKDLGQTEDEPVNGQDCHTLTAKVLGQKVKIWVDKSTFLIAQSEITLGGAISDADVDDACSLVAAGSPVCRPSNWTRSSSRSKNTRPRWRKSAAPSPRPRTRWN